MDEDLQELLDEYGIEDIEFPDDDFELRVLPTEEERPSWMD